MTTEPPADRPKFNPRTYQVFWQLLDEIKPAHDRYRRALRKAETTATDSPEYLAAQAKGNTALAEMETAIRDWVAATACTCPRLAVGMEVTEVRDWSRGCPEHGVYSTWWNSPEQQAKREARRAESPALQAKAKEMRLAARTGQEGWDFAEFQCGWCYATIAATSEREYVDLVVGHKETCPGTPAAAR